VSLAEVLAGERAWHMEATDALAGLRALPAAAVACICTSPPYWSLRSYGTDPQVWGGNPDCEHEWGVEQPGDKRGGSGPNAKEFYAGDSKSTYARGTPRGRYCSRCAAWSGELGSEPTPTEFVSHLVEVFRECRRVLRPDGVLFVNLADSSAGSGKGPSNSLQRPASSLNNRQLAAGVVPTQWVSGRSRVGSANGESGHTSGVTPPLGLKPKDLCLVPERFAIAMQDDGWWVRSRICWAKTSCMPESIKDRPTRAWEPIYMFSQSRRYYWDYEATRVPDQGRPSGNGFAGRQGGAAWLPLDGGIGTEEHWKPGEGRNLWDYWEIEPDDDDPFWKLGPEGLKDDHYAAFPTAIPRLCIAAGSREGDMVLDPFCGSGTTVLQALRMGRRGLGLDLNPQYVAMAERRILQDAPLFNTPGVGW
jgi:DNA modification methylase